jgi:hypothetical protein
MAKDISIWKPSRQLFWQLRVRVSGIGFSFTITMLQQQRTQPPGSKLIPTFLLRLNLWSDLNHSAGASGPQAQPFYPSVWPERQILSVTATLGFPRDWITKQWWIAPFPTEAEAGWNLVSELLVLFPILLTSTIPLWGHFCTGNHREHRNVTLGCGQKTEFQSLTMSLFLFCPSGLRMFTYFEGRKGVKPQPKVLLVCVWIMGGARKPQLSALCKLPLHLSSLYGHLFGGICV